MLACRKIVVRARLLSRGTFLVIFAKPSDARWLDPCNSVLLLRDDEPGSSSSTSTTTDSSTGTACGANRIGIGRSRVGYDEFDIFARTTATTRTKTVLPTTTATARTSIRPSRTSSLRWTSTGTGTGKWRCAAVLAGAASLTDFGDGTGTSCRASPADYLGASTG